MVLKPRMSQTSNATGRIAEAAPAIDPASVTSR